MTDLVVLPTQTVRISVTPRIPFTVLSRVVQNYGSVSVCHGSRVVVASDEEAGRWIITTLDMLGFAASMR